MSTVALSSVTHELSAICGPQNVVDDHESLANFDIDEITPTTAVSPGSAEEIAAVLAFASARNLSVVPAGGMSAQHCGNIPKQIDILLRTNRLSQIEFYDPGDLTVGLGAGCTLGSLTERLAEHQQFLPIDPMRPGASTMGGLLATAAHGPLAHGYGAIRDFCIGITFVTGDGKIAKGGGRVVKNVAGYDLMKLLIGSYGTLGVITSANFKVFPAATATRTFIMKFRSIAEAIDQRDRLAKSGLTPMCVELISPRASTFLRPATEARDPDTFAPENPVDRAGAPWKLALRAGGSDAVLVRYARELGATVSEQLSGEEERAWWEAISRFKESVFGRHRNTMMVRTRVLPSKLGEALAAAEAAALDNNFLLSAIGRAALGMLDLAFVPIAVDPPSAMQYATCISSLRARVGLESTVVVTRCPTEAKRHFSVWGSTATDFGSMLAVKQALDPKNILNRGRYLTDEC